MYPFIELGLAAAALLAHGDARSNDFDEGQGMEPDLEGLVAFPTGCASTLRDQASGHCLSAASTATLGRLYPLSRDFHVTPGGRIGVGVPNPQSRLHLSDGDLRVDDGAIELFGSGLQAGELFWTGLGSWFSMRSGAGNTTLAFDTYLGAGLDFFGAAGGAPVQLHGDFGDGGAAIRLGFYMDAQWESGATLVGYSGGSLSVQIESGSQGDGSLQLDNSDLITTVSLDGGSSGGGTLLLRAADGSSTVLVAGERSNGGGLVSVSNDDFEDTVELIGNTGFGNSGALSLTDGVTGLESVSLLGTPLSEDGGQLNLHAPDGTPAISIRARESNQAAGLYLHQGAGRTALNLAGPYFAMYDASGTPTIVYNRDTGSKNAVVNTPSHGRRLLYKTESPEVWFEDFGSGRLTDGRASITLDPVFLETVQIDERHPLLVFVTVTGDGPGVFVEKGRDGFTVRELAGGVSDASFDWRVAAKRRGPLADARLEPFVEEPRESRRP